MSITLIIIISTALITITAFRNSNLLNKLMLYPELVGKGQYYRLLSSGFVHADYPHLIFNMLSLWFFGRALEPFLKEIVPGGLLVFYLIAIVVSSIPSFLKHRRNSTYASLGASGGVSAILFAYIGLAPWSTIYIYFIPAPAIVFAVGYLIYSQYMNKKGGDNINHDAHFWGAIFGFLAIFVLRPSLIKSFIEELMHPHFGL